MPEEIVAIVIFSIVFGTGLVGFLFWNIFNLIHKRIDAKTQKSGTIDPQFFRALADFKKNTERRIAQLEAIVAELEEERIRIPDTDETTSEIEIEDEEVRTPTPKSESNLKNMLNE